MQTLDADDLLLFARVVDEGSFSRAAERVGLPKSTVSRRLAALEDRLGERLLLRTTRKLALTDFGRNVLEHARRVADEVAAAASLADHRLAEPSGRLRVSMPADVANTLVAQTLAQFLARYPAVSLELDLTPRRVDLIGENFDVVLRMGELSDETSLAARRLASFTTSAYAAPAYVARRGEPAEPEALMEHDTLRLLARSGDPSPWVMTLGDARWEGVPPGRATANSPELLTRLARAGSGIALLVDHFAQEFVERGELVPVLAPWTGPVDHAWAVFPGRHLMPARTRAFIDALAAQFEGPECKAKDAQVRAAKKARRAEAA